MQDLSTFQTTYAGWDFQNIWSPPNQAGQGGQTAAYYPQLYALTPVEWVIANDATRPSGLSNPSFTVAASYGGPADYIFGSPGDSLSIMLVSAGSAADGGSYAILNGSGPTATSIDGVIYRVLTMGTLTVVPAPNSRESNPGLVTTLLPTPSSATIVLPTTDIGDCSWAGIMRTLRAHGGVVLTGSGACGVQ
jgi:hypothetical protein